MAPPPFLPDAMPRRLLEPHRRAARVTRRLRQGRASGDACGPRRASCARSVLGEHDASWESATPVSRCPRRHRLDLCPGARGNRTTRSACGRGAAPALTNGIRWPGQSPPSHRPRRPHLPLVTVPVPDKPTAASRSSRGCGGWRASHRQWRRAPRLWPRRNHGSQPVHLLETALTVTALHPPPQRSIHAGPVPEGIRPAPGACHLVCCEGTGGTPWLPCPIRGSSGLSP